MRAQTNRWRYSELPRQRSLRQVSAAIAFTCGICSPAASDQDDDVALTAKVRIASVNLAVMDLALQARNDVIDNYAYEAVRCFVYYQILLAGDLVGSENEQRIENISLLLHIEASEFMKHDVLNARTQIEFDSMIEDKLHRSLDRISILVADIGRMCKIHLEKPEERINYWRRQLGY